MHGTADTSAGDNPTITYTKLIDITSTSDIGSSTNMIDITTLSDDTERQEPGIKRLGDGLQFGGLYSKSDYKKLRALEGLDEYYAIYKGGTTADAATAVPDGHDGIWKFKGKLVVTVNGAGVDEAFAITVTIAPSTVIELVDTASST